MDQELTVYLNVSKHKRSKYSPLTAQLHSVTKDGPSKAAAVIASVRVKLLIPESLLIDGPPVYASTMRMSGDRREELVVSVDMLEQIVPPLEHLTPAQPPAAGE